MGVGNEIILYSNKNNIIKISENKIPKYKRNSQGIKLINLKKNEFLIGVEIINDN